MSKNSKEDNHFKMCFKKVTSDDIKYNKKFSEKNKKSVLHVLNS